MSKGAWSSPWHTVPLSKCQLLSLLSSLVLPKYILSVKEVHLGNPAHTNPLRKAQFLVKNHLFNSVSLGSSWFDSLSPPNPY